MSRQVRQVSTASITEYSLDIITLYPETKIYSETIILEIAKNCLKDERFDW